MASGKRIATMIIGMIVIVGGFFGGFIMFLSIDPMDTGTILFYILVIPMITALIGIGIIMYGIRDEIEMGGGFGLFRTVQPRASQETREKTYIYEPPRFCKDCGASLSAENIEWAGPLTIKCPYCGATHPTEKREV
ncbi:MAG: hypothetical protein ACFFCP_15280 [Promethearchaeota archaeon]